MIMIKKNQTGPVAMSSLSDLWGDWLSNGKAVPARTYVTLTFVKETILPYLTDQGFAVPSQRSLGHALAFGLDSLPTNVIVVKEVQCCSFAHIVNLIWVPVIQYMEKLIANPGAPECEWTSQLECNHKALLAEMAGVSVDANENMDIDGWVLFLKQELWKKLRVEVPEKLILDVCAPVVPLQVAPTPANALHLLRSSLCSKLVGPSLAAQMSRMTLAGTADVPVELVPAEDLSQQIKQDIVAMLAQQYCCEEFQDNLEQQPAKKMKRDTESIQGTLSAKTAQVKFMVKNRLASYRVKDTVQDSHELLTLLNDSSSSLGPEATDELLYHRCQLQRHMLLLDGAVDRYTSEHLLTLREEGRFAGVALVTDESPPNKPRFRGLRFQITVFFCGAFQPVSQWESSQDPPMSCTTCLADIMHCPGKKGVDVSRVLEKQLSRLGLNCFDVTAGTGDGGGENEGHLGVHAFFENLSPGYVRHRCIPHIAWRTCDVAIRVSGLDHRALAVYLVDGITWSRLRDLACKQKAFGGLELFKDGSKQCKNIFGKSPSAIVDGRPETDLQFLKLLEGKEHVLHQLATRDLSERELGTAAKTAVLNLGSIKNRIRRRVLQELLERCLFLNWWSGKHKSIVLEASWDELMRRAVSIILDLEVTPEVLQRFKVDDTVLEDMQDKTWVGLAVRQVVGEAELVAEHLPEALDFHRQVSDQTAAHLNLLADNTWRTPWMAAKILSKDVKFAQNAARTLARHLASTKPENKTAFEEHLFSQQSLWKPLEEFAHADPPTLLWHSKGKYESLFKFLAPRFLLAPDHVLDAERVHARWQWTCSVKRSIKLQSLNATLRLMHYMEHNQTFPDDMDLLEHLEAERMEHKLAMQALTDDDEVALGWRSEFMYRKRFNLAVQDADLLVEFDPAVPHGHDHGSPFVLAWRNYMKLVFQKGFMYRLSINPAVVLYVAENKTLAGKEDRTYEGEAQGRKLAVVLFEDMGQDLIILL